MFVKNLCIALNKTCTNNIVITFKYFLLISKNFYTSFFLRHSQDKFNLSNCFILKTLHISYSKIKLVSANNSVKNCPKTFNKKFGKTKNIRLFHEISDASVAAVVYL